MEGDKTAKIASMKENGGSKVPKLIRVSSTRETKSQALVAKKTAQSLKTTAKVASVTSTKLKRTQISNQKKNLKPMSIVKISEDVMNCFEVENLKSDDLPNEGTSGITAHKKEAKREPLKEKFSQVPQKQSGNLRRQQSEPNWKPYAAFGGMRFNAKRENCHKIDIFKNVMKESKDLQAINPPEPCTEELKTTVSVEAIASKEIKSSNEGTVEKPSTITAGCSKGKSLTVKKYTFKNYKAFGGAIFKPKWHSTPLKPDISVNMQKASKQNKELNAPDSSAKCQEKALNPTTAIKKERDETIVLDETLQSPAEESKTLKLASQIAKQNFDKKYPPFGGLRLTPKRKSTHQKPDIFEKVQESKINNQESNDSDSKVEKVKAETHLLKVEKLELPTTQKPESTKKDDVSKNVKKVVPQAFGGIRFKQREKNNLYDVF